MIENGDSKLANFSLAISRSYGPNPGQEQACAELLASLDGLPNDVVQPAMDDALQLVEGSIKRADALMQKMRTLQNSSVRINRLPAELLVEIFWRVAALVWRAKHRRFQHYYGLICVTHVCRHWRTVALDAARLWATIRIVSPEEHEWDEFDDKRRVMEYLYRSKSHPLDIRIHELSESNADGCIETLHPHLHRIQKLRIRVETDSIMRIVISSLRTVAAQLEELDLDASHTSLIRRRYTSLTLWPPRHVFFEGHTPLLHSLRLSLVTIPLNSVILRNLRHLTLHKQNMPITHMDTFLDVLDNCPDLEMLSVQSHGRFPSSPLPPTRTDRVVSLSALQTLAIAWQQPMFSSLLLAHAHLPRPTKLRLIVDVDQHLEAEGPGAQLIILDNRLLRPTGNDSIYTLSSIHTLRIMTHPNISFEGYIQTDRDPITVSPGLSPCTEPALTITLDGRRPSLAHVMTSFMQAHRGAVPFSVVHTLIFDCTDLTLSSDDWAHIFGAMLRLRTLHLFRIPRRSLLSCFRALCPSEVAEDQAFGDGTQLLVGLETMKVHESNFVDKELRAVLERTLQHLSAKGALERLQLVRKPRARPKVNEELVGQFCTVEIIVGDT
ncbi:uncharacterized protein B0H18DRAFT_1006741 [Fomitopsis serialis]|uniref:uncharacterized protein n=1 Tax=Fomitopsis serialis TaxID=139415 RepID=UPI002007D3C3|nr:uncharacterized protein B0H18DRAFT_1006741 [Neoantrodia serialis]KAH9926155.1 hypothetical protein B0H18DRAFT_1006741 [Neoantrodia serialis]